MCSRGPKCLCGSTLFFPISGDTVNRLSLLLGVVVALLLAVGCGPSANPRDSARSAAQPALDDSGELKAPNTIYDGVNITPKGLPIRLKDHSGTPVQVVGRAGKALAALPDRKLNPDQC